jgi:hypothetical protein
MGIGHDTLEVGQWVLYVLESGPSTGQARPAVIVRTWDIEQYRVEGRVNLHVLTDFNNDGEGFASGNVWRTSVPFSANKEPGTWHWAK